MKLAFENDHTLCYLMFLRVFRHYKLCGHYHSVHCKQRKEVNKGDFSRAECVLTRWYISGFPNRYKSLLTCDYSVAKISTTSFCPSLAYMGTLYLREVRPNRNLLFQTHLFCMTIWSGVELFSETLM